MTLDTLREKIDRVDTALLALFEERMDIVLEIAALKAAEGLPILDRSREAAKLREIEAKARPDLAPYAHILYNTLFELSRDLQNRTQEENA